MIEYLPFIGSKMRVGQTKHFNVKLHNLNGIGATLTAIGNC